MSIAQQIMANPGRYSKEQLQSALNQGLVPAYIAIPLIEQKAKEAAAYKTAELAAQAPQQNAPTVAEEVLARANQPMGVPSLPTNLPEGYAPGGIVAFDDGGEVGMAEGGVVGYADRGLVSSMPNYQTSLDTMLERRAALIRRYQDLENSGQAQVDEDRANVLNILETPARIPYNAAASITEGIGGLASRAANFFTGKPTYEGTKRPRFEKRTSELSKIEQQIRDLNKAIDQTERQGALPIKDNPMGLPAPAGPAAPAGGIDRLPAAPGMPNISTKLGRASTVYTPEVLAALRNAAEVPELDEKKFVGETPTTEASIKTVRDLQKAFGVSEKPYEEQGERLGKREKDLEKRKAESVWDAVIRAGLATAAGTSQYALTNIAKGGLEGLQQYTSAREKLDESQERLDAARFSLADAQNRFRQEGSKEAGADYREAQRDFKSATREYLRDSVVAKRKTQELKQNIEFNRLTDLSKVRDTNLDQAAKEIGFQIQRAGLDIQRFNAETQRFIANRPTEASFLIENAKRLFPNDPGKQTDYFVEQASAAASRAGTSTLQAKIYDVKNKAIERLQFNSAYKKAEKAGDKEKMRQLEQEEYDKVLKESPGATGEKWGELQVSGG